MKKIVSFLFLLFVCASAVDAQELRKLDFEKFSTFALMEGDEVVIIAPRFTKVVWDGVQLFPNNVTSNKPRTEFPDILERALVSIVATTGGKDISRELVKITLHNGETITANVVIVK
jgi:hypothetical protein